MIKLKHIPLLFSALLSYENCDQISRGKSMRQMCKTAGG